MPRNPFNFLTVMLPFKKQSQLKVQGVDSSNLLLSSELIIERWLAQRKDPVHHVIRHDEYDVTNVHYILQYISLHRFWIFLVFRNGEVR